MFLGIGLSVGMLLGSYIKAEGGNHIITKGWDSQVLVELQKTSVYNIQSDQFSEQL